MSSPQVKEDSLIEGPSLWTRVGMGMGDGAIQYGYPVAPSYPVLNW